MKNFLERFSSGKNILILFVAFFVFNMFLFPYYIPIIEPLDLKFAYSSKQAYQLIEGYGETDRQIYANGLIYIDFVYPVIYGLMFSFLLFRIKKSVILAQIPLLASLADFIENIGIITLLQYFPGKNLLLAGMTSMFTTLKWFSIMASLSILAILLVQKLIKKPQTVEL
ncbi:hypothetical protein P872_19950 [Rhodonellum psychrophilum GCM71 = DSM 17998]|uniref:DUF4386 domain-containing protein n=2 Tax=Rhodonellum TaxID=336827 RepID=U5BMA6_9BACT|nr:MULTISPECIES: hypothetical protein [Rhodonellum]ERM81630.1 hypothetical protein P872_19950 [Rhodonellum psychrophilum GCM71 = DSM 17998]SDZ33339.1 hypothetical protein SAMN05444412_110137 [Rhodonellum ikkaensis]